MDFFLFFKCFDSLSKTQHHATVMLRCGGSKCEIVNLFNWFFLLDPFQLQGFKNTSMNFLLEPNLISRNCTASFTFMFFNASAILINKTHQKHSSNICNLYLVYIYTYCFIFTCWTFILSHPNQKQTLKWIWIKPTHKPPTPKRKKTGTYRTFHPTKKKAFRGNSCHPGASACRSNAWSLRPGAELSEFGKEPKWKSWSKSKASCLGRIHPQPVDGWVPGNSPGFKGA